MKITIDKAFFEKVIPAAASSTEEIFLAVQPAFTEAEKAIKSELIGPFDIDNCEEEMIQVAYAYAVVCKAFLDTMPHLDLVLTPTGFGVVSNQNVAPASADRVDKLRKQIQKTYDFNYEVLLHNLLGEKAWAMSPQAVSNISHLIYDLLDFSHFCKYTDFRSDLINGWQRIEAAEQHLRQNFSPDLFYYLLKQIRNRAVNEKEGLLLEKMRSFIGAYYNSSSDVSALRAFIEEINNYLEKNFMEFPVYENSSTYKAKHFQYYENKKEDGSFFFG